ncbi:MAG: hypothetical protein ACREHV_11785 [Rhizomicrobium sp.]
MTGIRLLRVAAFAAALCGLGSALALASPVNPSFKPNFGGAAPGTTTPKNQLYFQTPGILPYVYYPAGAAWEQFGSASGCSGSNGQILGIIGGACTGFTPAGDLGFSEPEFTVIGIQGVPFFNSPAGNNTVPVFQSGLGEINWTAPTVVFPLTFKANQTQSSGTTCYSSVVGYDPASACGGVNGTSQLWPLSGTFGAISGYTGSGLFVNVQTAPGLGQSMIVTLMVNGSASGVSCSVLGAVGNCSNTTDSVAVSAGATLAYQVIQSASSVAAQPSIAITASGP